MAYTIEQIKNIATKLKEMPEIKKEKKVSKQEAVKILKNEITFLKKRGYSLEQISNSLKGNGLDISTPTLKSYLQRARRTPKNSIKKEPEYTVFKSTSLKETKVDILKATFETKPDADEI